MTIILYHIQHGIANIIVFAPKYRRRVFYSENRLEIGQILRELCNGKG